MVISLEDYIKTLPLECQEAIEPRAQELIAEEKTLRELRKAAASSSNRPNTGSESGRHF